LCTVKWKSAPASTSAATTPGRAPACASSIQRAAARQRVGMLFCGQRARQAPVEAERPEAHRPGPQREPEHLYWSKTLLLLLTWCFMLAGTR
jgi:hypothetical protein